MTVAACMQVLDALASTPRYKEVLSLGVAAGQEQAEAGLVVSLLRHRTAHERAPVSADKPAAKARYCPSCCVPVLPLPVYEP